MNDEQTTRIRAVHDKQLSEYPWSHEPPPVETLWVTDAELIRRLGVPEKIARQTLREVDRVPSTGFPRKDPVWGNRRYWPAVKAYFERRHAKMDPPRRDR